MPGGTAQPGKQAAAGTPWSLAARRSLLGAAALTLLTVGFVLLFLHGVKQSDTSMLSGICLRAGSVLGVLWLALPQLVQLSRTVSPWKLVTVLAIVVVAIFSRSLAILLPLFGLLVGLQVLSWLFKKAPPRPRRTRSRGGTSPSEPE